MRGNLITGGFGFLGTHLARQLLEDGEKVVLFQRRRTPPPGVEDIQDRVEIVRGDVSNWVHVFDALKKYDIDCVYHTAALLVRECEDSPAAGYQVNVGGTFNVLEAARILGVRQVVFVSSVFTYGSVPPRKISDDTPQRPESMYATTKVCCERLGEYYRRRYGVDFRGIRFAMVIGPGRQPSYYYADYSGAIEMAARGKPYTIHVPESSAVALIYVKDVVQALTDLQRAPENKLRQQVYNIHGFTATMGEITHSVRTYLPNAQIVFEADRSEEMRRAHSNVSYEMDNTRAREDFGWHLRYPLNKMVEDFIDEIKAGRGTETRKLIGLD